jgi:hypothetical protein
MKLSYCCQACGAKNVPTDLDHFDSEQCRLDDWVRDTSAAILKHHQLLVPRCFEPQIFIQDILGPRGQVH